MPKRTTYMPNGYDNPSSCCGPADAYWVDQIDKVTDKGVYATITDDRDCKVGGSPGQRDGETCILHRQPRNGQHVFIPNERLDDRGQGNPTGHNVVFLGAGSEMYADALWPRVYCFFPNFLG